MAWCLKERALEKRSPLGCGVGKGFFWSSGIPDLVRSVIFKRRVIVPDYCFGFCRVRRCCRKEGFPVDQV